MANDNDEKDTSSEGGDGKQEKIIKDPAGTRARDQLFLFVLAIEWWWMRLSLSNKKQNRKKKEEKEKQ